MHEARGIYPDAGVTDRGLNGGTAEDFWMLIDEYDSAAIGIGRFGLIYRETKLLVI